MILDKNNPGIPDSVKNRNAAPDVEKIFVQFQVMEAAIRLDVGWFKHLATQRPELQGYLNMTSDELLQTLHFIRMNCVFSTVSQKKESENWLRKNCKFSTH